MPYVAILDHIFKIALKREREAKKRKKTNVLTSNNTLIIVVVFNKTNIKCKREDNV